MNEENFRKTGTIKKPSTKLEADKYISVNRRGAAGHGGGRSFGGGGKGPSSKPKPIVPVIIPAHPRRAHSGTVKYMKPASTIFALIPLLCMNV